VPAVNAGEPRRLGLEVRFDAQPIQGRLYDQRDSGLLDRPFSGWLGLMSAIEAARGAEASPRQRKGEVR
jgi:hypothetical protein